MNDIDLILKDPSWFPYDLVDEYSIIEFVKTDAQALRGAPFLDVRFAKRITQRARVSVTEIQNRLPTTKPASPMIFHSAFCCSTLMAKAIDFPGKCLALKEPNIVMALANAKRMLKCDDTAFAELYRAIMTLLSRRFQTSEQIVLKLPNTANNLLENAKETGSPRLFIYASLEDFLVSVLKKGEYCKTLVRTHYNIFSLDRCKLAEIDARQAMTLTDLQVAALVWRHQLELFERHKTSAMTLQDKVFLADKKAAMISAVRKLGLPHTNDDIDGILCGPLFSQDVKFEGRELNAKARSDAAQQVRLRYQGEIQATLSWAKKLRLDGDVLPEVLI